MSRRHRAAPCPVLLSLLLAVVLAAGTVSAHAPITTGSNEDLANATMLLDPEKSYALYTGLHEGGEAQYYRFPMRAGQRLYGSLQVPGADSPVPDLVLIGPGIVSSGSVPPFVQVPTGSGAMVVEGEPPEGPSYEPFTPQPIYEAARFDATGPQDGDYYVAVHGPEGGKYSLAPGFREEFTVDEWLLIPWSVVSIHLWEGQSPAYIFAPLVVVLAGGLALVVVYRRRRGPPPDEEHGHPPLLFADGLHPRPPERNGGRSYFIVFTGGRSRRPSMRLRPAGSAVVRKCYLCAPASPGRMTTTSRSDERRNRHSGTGELARARPADESATTGGAHAVH